MLPWKSRYFWRKNSDLALISDTAPYKACTQSNHINKHECLYDWQMVNNEFKLYIKIKGILSKQIKLGDGLYTLKSRCINNVLTMDFFFDPTKNAHLNGNQGVFH